MLDLANCFDIGDLGIPSFYRAGELFGELVESMAPAGVRVGALSSFTLAVFLPGADEAAAQRFVTRVRTAGSDRVFELVDGNVALLHAVVGVVPVPAGTTDIRPSVIAATRLAEREQDRLPAEWGRGPIWLPEPVTGQPDDARPRPRASGLGGLRRHGSFYDQFRLRDRVAGTVMAVHLVSYAEIWMERGHHWLDEELDALADLIGGVLPRDARVGYLARTLLGAFLPHTTADQASRLARDIRAAAESAHRPGRPEGWPLAIGLEPVEGQEPVASDLELLAHATAEAEADQERYPAEQRAQLWLLDPVHQVLGRARDPAPPPDARVGDHHLRALCKIHDRAVDLDPRPGAGVLGGDGLRRGATACTYFGLTELADLLAALPHPAALIAPESPGLLAPLASVNITKVLTKAMELRPHDFAPTVR